MFIVNQTLLRTVIFVNDDLSSLTADITKTSHYPFRTSDISKSVLYCVLLQRRIRYSNKLATRS